MWITSVFLFLKKVIHILSTGLSTDFGELSTDFRKLSTGDKIFQGEDNERSKSILE